jgi:hypothetical protein
MKNYDNSTENYRKLQKITENYRKLRKITEIRKNSDNTN